MDASDDERESPPEVLPEEDKCVCLPEVQNIEEPTYRSPVKSEPRASGSADKKKCKCKCKKCKKKKIRPVLKLCPGDASVREGEYALTVSRVAEKYNYKSPTEFDEDSGESLGSLEGDYDPAVIEMNLQAAMPDSVPRGQEAIEEVVRDANWGGGRAISYIRGKIEEVIPPPSESGSSE